MLLCATSLLLEQGKKTRFFAPAPHLGLALEFYSWESLRQPTACGRVSCGLRASVFTPGFCRVQPLPSVSLHTPLKKTWPPLCRSAAVAPKPRTGRTCSIPLLRALLSAAFLPRCLVHKVRRGDETSGGVPAVPSSSRGCWSARCSGGAGPYGAGRSQSSSRELLRPRPQEGQMLGEGWRAEALPIAVTLGPHDWSPEHAPLP